MNLPDRDVFARVRSAVLCCVLACVGRVVECFTDDPNHRSSGERECQAAGGVEGLFPLRPTNPLLPYAPPLVPQSPLNYAVDAPPATRVNYLNVQIAISFRL